LTGEEQKATSSIEIEKNSRGYSYTVKVYAVDNTGRALVEARHAAEEQEQRLAESYGPKKPEPGHE